MLTVSHKQNKTFEGEKHGIERVSYCNRNGIKHKRLSKETTFIIRQAELGI